MSEIDGLIACGDKDDYLVTVSGSLDLEVETEHGWNMSPDSYQSRLIRIDIFLTVLATI